MLLHDKHSISNAAPGSLHVHILGGQYVTVTVTVFSYFADNNRETGTVKPIKQSKLSSYNVHPTTSTTIEQMIHHN